MPAVHLASLMLIAITWLASWHVGRRWARWCGVDERFSQFALACVLPTAGLLLAVHLVATVSMLAGRGWVTPESVGTVFIVLAWLAHRVVPKQNAPPRPVATPSSLPRAWSSAPVLVVIGIYCVFLLDALTRYPTGCDAVVYQLVVAVRWARGQALNLVLGHSGYSYPNNGMIVPFLLAFAKLESLFPVVHLPKALLLGAAVFGLARTLGAGRQAATVAACIALSIPIVVFQSFSAYVDLYAASAWVTALLAVVWSTRVPETGKRQSLVVIAGLAAGVALGSKVTYVVLVAMLALVVLASDWIRTGHPRIVTARALARVGTFCLAALCCSGFWFVRGAVQAGNPVYPLTVKMPENGLLPTLAIATASGAITSEETFNDESLAARAAWSAAYAWRESKRGAGYTFGVDNGLGAAFAAFIPIGLAWAAFCALTQRARDGATRWRMICVALALSSGLLLVTVFHDTIRFVLPLVIVAVAVAVASLDRVIDRFPRHAAVALVVCLIATGAISTLKPAHAMLGRARDGNWQRDWFYQIPSLVDEFPPDTRIVNLADEPLNYPLLGAGLTNDVIAPLLWAVLSKDSAVTAASLRENSVDYLFVRAPWPDDWPADLPVKLVYDDTDSRVLATTPASRIYRVIGTRTMGGPSL